MLSRSSPALSVLALLAMTFASTPAQASEWSADFSNGSISASVGRRGHRVSNRRYAPRKVWVAGRYVLEKRRVWVAGTKRKVYVEPVYETRYDDCGRAYQVLICEGHYRVIRDPGCYEIRRVRVWRPGFWRVTRRSDC